MEGGGWMDGWMEGGWREEGRMDGWLLSLAEGCVPSLHVNGWFPAASLSACFPSLFSAAAPDTFSNLPLERGAQPLPHQGGGGGGPRLKQQRLHMKACDTL